MKTYCLSQISGDPTPDQVYWKESKVAPSKSRLCEPRQSFHELRVVKLSQASKKQASNRGQTALLYVCLPSDPTSTASKPKRKQNWLKYKEEKYQNWELGGRMWWELEMEVERREKNYRKTVKPFAQAQREWKQTAKEKDWRQGLTDYMMRTRTC